MDDDHWMAKTANLDVADYRAFIKKPARKLIDDFWSSWQRQPKRGRKPEAKRNALITALAQLFHEQSGWEARYGDKEYRVGLRAFLMFILEADDIHAPPDRLVRLRVLAPKRKDDPDYRKPRP